MIKFSFLILTLRSATTQASHNTGPKFTQKWIDNGINWVVPRPFKFRTTDTDTENSLAYGIYKIHKHNILESYIEFNMIRLPYDVGSSCAIETEKQPTVVPWWLQSEKQNVHHLYEP